MRLVQVENGIVVNISVGSDGQEIPAGWHLSDVAGIGWSFVDGVFSAPSASVAVVVPPRVSRFQAMAALLNAGLLDQVNQIVAASDALTRLAWAEAVEFSRSSPLIASLAVQVGLTEMQVDDLFISAEKITV